MSESDSDSDSFIAPSFDSFNSSINSESRASEDSLRDLQSQLSELSVTPIRRQNQNNDKDGEELDPEQGSDQNDEEEDLKEGSDQDVDRKQNKMTEVTIGGVKIAVSNTPSTNTQGSLVILKKEERQGLAPDKGQDFFNQMTKPKQQDSYKLQSLSLAEVQDLQETYNLQLNISRTETMFTRYDMIGVFSIVFPVVDGNGDQTGALKTIVNEKGDTVAKTKKLFADYGTLTKQEVVESTKWYAMWLNEARSLWFKENIILSHDYLE